MAREGPGHSTVGAIRYHFVDITETPTDPEHWQQIETLYHHALESDGDDRGALLQRADPAIRRAVEDLLVHTESKDGPLDRPAWQSENPQDSTSIDLTPGQQLGPYVVDAAIGAGGMGRVYRATDTRLDRVVAGCDSPLAAKRNGIRAG